MDKKPFLLELTTIQEEALLNHVKAKNQDDNEEKYYSLTEAIEIIGCSKATLYLHRKEGLINTVKVGKMEKITKSEINKYLNK